MRTRLNGTPYVQMRRYTLWSLTVICVLIPLAMATRLADAPRWRWTDAALLAVSVLHAMCAAAAAVSLTVAEVEGPGVGSRVGGFLRHRPVALLLVTTAVGLGLAVLGSSRQAGPGLTGAALAATILLAGLVFAVAAGLPMRRSLALIAGLALLVGVISHLDAGRDAADLVFALPTMIAAFFVMTGLAASSRMSVWVLSVMKQQDEGAAVRAELAVAEERLRFSRDLHDVFGRTLTVVAVKSDLAAELADAGMVERAAQQMREVHRLAEESLKEVRGVVAGYRAVDLGAELRGARALLQSAGIRARVIGQADDVPARAAQALAWVVREGVTNVVRHSSATAATVRVQRDTGGVAVTIENDGAAPIDTAGAATRSGNGLRGLRDRLAPLHGTLEASYDGDAYRLTARVPEETA